MNQFLRNTTLSAPRRQLVERMQVLNFGRIESLIIRNGDPVLDPTPRIVREIKPGGDNGPRPERLRQDFLLKQQVVELCQVMEEIGTGSIDLIEVKNGLPFRLLVAEKANG